jgi:hypothetical protein
MKSGSALGRQQNQENVESRISAYAMTLCLRKELPYGNCMDQPAIDELNDCNIIHVSSRHACTSSVDGNNTIQHGYLGLYSSSHAE